MKKNFKQMLCFGVGLLWLSLPNAQPLPAASSAYASTDVQDQLERTRIAAERKAVESRFTKEETDCYSKFATHDCLNQARVQRRQNLADLRRQEISLNDAQRKRRGAEQIRKLENRQNTESAKQ